MNTLYDPFPVAHREAWIPDLFDGDRRYRTSTPGGCTCKKNYAHPHYMPCAHVRLLRTGFAVENIWPADFDGTRAYVLVAVERYHNPSANGCCRPGLWRYYVYFDGASVHLESRHVNTGYTKREVLPQSRYAEWNGPRRPHRYAHRRT